MTQTTAYRACHLCEAICGLAFEFENGGLKRIRGDAQDPFSKGHICPKGNAILDLENDPDRLTQPMLRVGDSFQPIGWAQAYELAGSELARIQREHGANAIGAYLGNPSVHHFGTLVYAAQLLRQLKTQNVFSASSVDQWPHQQVCALMYGHQFLLPIPDVDHCDYFLMLGANPAASMGSLMTAPGIVARLKLLTASGKLVVVDPRRTETAAIASEHVSIVPGTDAWLLVGILHALQRLGPPRLAHYGDALNGFEHALTQIGALQSADLFARCGVDASTVERIARELLSAKNPIVYGRIGVSIQAFGSLCQWLIQLINLYLGALDQVGGVLPTHAALPITGPGTSPGAFGRWRSRVRGLAEFAGELPVAALSEEIATAGDGQIRGLITVCGNPVLSTPNGRALEMALPTLEFQLAFDIYINETTRFANLILPPASALKHLHYDSIFNAFAVRNVSRINAPLLAREDNDQLDYEILSQLTASFCQHANKPFQPLPPPETLIAQGLKRGPFALDYDTLLGAPHGVDLGPLKPSLMQRLQTASGKIECAPLPLLQDLERLAATAMPAPSALRLIGRREIRSNNSWMHNAPRLIKGKARHQLMMHPIDLAARGLTDGTQVRVRSNSGEIITDVVASDTMRPGVACLPHGYGHQRGGTTLSRASLVQGASYNDLSDAGALDALGNAALNGLVIEVVALEDQNSGATI